VGGLLYQQLRSRCEDTIWSLTIPSPFGLEPFRECLEQRRGQPVRLIPTKATTECSGLWVGTPDMDYIFYERSATPLHQLHIVAHEAGHMFFGHKGQSISDEEFSRLLFPDLPPELVTSMLGRSAYTDTQEREAETFATLLLNHVMQLPPRADLPPDKTVLLRRLEDAFTAHPSQQPRRKRP
jgi:hypothetical protein